MFKVYLCFAFLFLQGLPTSAYSPVDTKQSETGDGNIDTLNVNYLNQQCWLLRKTDPLEAIAIGNKSLELAERMGYDKGMAQVLNYLGVCYLKLNDARTASSYFFKALAFSDSLNIKIEKGYALNNIASALILEGEYKQALNYTNKALLLQTQNNDRKGIAYAWLRMSDVYYRLQHYDSLLITAKMAHALLVKLNMPDNDLLALKNIARGWEGKRQYKNALTCYLEIMKADTTVKSIYVSLARVCNLLNLPDQAIHYGKKWLNTQKGNGYILQHLSDAYALKEDWKEAYRYSRLSQIFIDSLVTAERNVQLKNMRILYKTRETELENVGLKAKLSVKNLYLFTLGIIILLIGLLLTILLGRRKQQLHLNHILNQKNEEICTQRDRLEEINQTKDKLFSIIAHDLRGPIGNVATFLELLTTDEGEFTKEELLNNLILLKNSSNATFKLLENLLTWSLSQRGEIEFKPSKNDLSKLVQSNIDLFASNAENKKIQIVNTPYEQLIFEFDHDMINTVMRNLINNAIKYTHEKGQITISAIGNHQHVEISVKDSGIGIDTKTAQQLFVTQINLIRKVGTNGEKGTGLGLMLCREFVEKHSGKIWVESKVDIGSTFKFTLPLRHSIELFEN